MNSIADNRTPGKASANKKGVLTCRKSGTIAIELQVKVKEGKKSKWVQAPSVKQSDVILNVNKSKKIKLKNVSKKKEVTFTSDNESVVTVNEKGMMKVLASGSAKISIEIEDDPNEYFVNVTVK